MVLFGMLLASFVLCMVDRYGKNGGIRSICEYCGHVLAWYELIPVVSYILQKGKCRHCGKVIKKKYLIAEILGGCIGGLISVCMHTYLNQLIILVLVINAMYIAIIDHTYFEIPFVAMGIIVLLGFIYFLHQDLLIHILNGSLCILIGGILYIFTTVIRHKEMFGLGDILLLSGLCIWIGYEVIYVLLFSSICGLVESYVYKKDKIAFGVYLSIFGTLYICKLFTFV